MSAKVILAWEHAQTHKLISTCSMPPMIYCKHAPGQPPLHCLGLCISLCEVQRANHKCTHNLAQRCQSCGAHKVLTPIANSSSPSSFNSFILLSHRKSERDCPTPGGDHMKRRTLLMQTPSQKTCEVQPPLKKTEGEKADWREEGIGLVSSCVKSKDQCFT